MQSKRNNTPSNIENEEITQRPKTVHFASNSWSQTEIYTDIKKVNDFMEQTMKNLLVCNENLKTCLNTDQTYLEIIGNYLNILFL